MYNFPEQLLWWQLLVPFHEGLGEKGCILYQGLYLTPVPTPPQGLLLAIPEGLAPSPPLSSATGEPPLPRDLSGLCLPNLLLLSAGLRG